MLQSNIGFLHCLWDIVQRITRTSERHPCQKNVITHCIQNQGDVASTWVFMCLFCLRIYCFRLKGVYCGVDAIMASSLCSMFFIHLQKIACYWCSTVPFCNLQWYTQLLCPFHHDCHTVTHLEQNLYIHLKTMQQTQKPK
jgi:hypothetical protein